MTRTARTAPHRPCRSRARRQHRSPPARPKRRVASGAGGQVATCSNYRHSRTARSFFLWLSDAPPKSAKFLRQHDAYTARHRDRLKKRNSQNGDESRGQKSRPQRGLCATTAPRPLTRPVSLGASEGRRVHLRVRGILVLLRFRWRGGDGWPISSVKSSSVALWRSFETNSKTWRRSTPPTRSAISF